MFIIVNGDNRMKNFLLIIAAFLGLLFISCENMGYDAIADLETSTAGGISGPLIYYFKFDNADNLVAIDSSGNNLNGTIDGISVVSGKVDNAFNFNNGNVVIPSYNFGLANKISIKVWFKLYNLTNTSSFVGTSQSYRLMYSRYSDTIEFDLDNSTVIELNTSITIDQWYHIAVTYSGSEAKIYINGTLDNTNNISLAIGNSYFGTDIGGSHGFDGALDELRVYNTVRTAQEIADYYAQTSKKKKYQ